MSTSLLYHGWGIRGYRLASEGFEEGRIVQVIEQDEHRLRCAECGSGQVVRRGRMVREFRAPPIGRKAVFIRFAVPRLGCACCGAVRQSRLEFADERVRYTRAMARYVLDLCRLMTLTDVAAHLGLSWDTVKDIHKERLRKRFTRPRLKDLEMVAIDEISIGRGHRYLTVVLDLRSGAVVFVGNGRGAEALSPFWKRVRASRAHIRAVAMDMSPAYLKAVSTCLPGARIVFDRFHVMKLFNDKLSDLRRALQASAEGMAKRVLKGTRWLLLRNPENLDEAKDERRRLDDALRLNEPLATAYYMKDDLRQFWEQEDLPRARRFLDDWIGRARVSGVRVLVKLAATLAGHRSGLLAWYEYPISTGPLEGTNNKIKTLQKQAYGYRDREYFMLRIYALHESKYALVG